MTPPEKISYCATASGSHRDVLVVDDKTCTFEPLNPRLDLVEHSPGGFRWGYGGSAPAQLALAICAHALGDDHRALAVYQLFKTEVLAPLPGDQGWTALQSWVLEKIAELEASETLGDRS